MFEGMRHFDLGRIECLKSLGRWVLILAQCLIVKTQPVVGQATGTIELNLIDSASGQAMEGRVQLRGSADRLLRPKALALVQGWSLVEDRLYYRGRPGDYDYAIFRGPEYAPVRGRFTLDKKAHAADEIKLVRKADLASEGWYAGDLLSRLSIQQTQPWFKVEGLSIASTLHHVIQSEANQQPAKRELAGRAEEQTYSGFLDERPGSGLAFHHWQPRSQPTTDTPSSRLLVQAKSVVVQPGELPIHIEIQKLWARDVPVWLASGRIDSVQVLSEHLTYDGRNAATVDALVQPSGKFQGPQGPGRLVEQIYWNLLEAGLRLPPTAGSGFGQTTSPLGYNRVYAQVGQPEASDQNQSTWWQAVRQGRCFVTSGPLIRAMVNGMPPGHVFLADKAVELDCQLTITAVDPVEYVEVIANGQSIYRAALDNSLPQPGRIPLLKMTQSGWLIIRVVAGNEDTYRLAMTAPFYFEIAGQRRVSKQAVSYFQRWLEQSGREVQKLSPQERSAHQPFLSAAERFWQTQSGLASSD
ncbi:MAG TPA: hypothetical protein DCF63_20095 [Planctomycetaceae bacterium]|nr:hypothetical protein [Planctomycetaceae bacterium]